MNTASIITEKTGIIAWGLTPGKRSHTKHQRQQFEYSAHKKTAAFACSRFSI